MNPELKQDPSAWAERSLCPLLQEDRRQPRCYACPGPALPCVLWARELRVSRGVRLDGQVLCDHSGHQSWWHPGHEVLRPNLPQQHRVFRWPCPLCLLLSGEPVQPQCCLRPDRQPWGYMGQRLYQPTVGTASSCLVRAWVAFPYHRGSVCNLSSILPRPSPGCYSLSHH